MKKYPCRLSEQPCKYAGNKRWDWGFARGIAGYCRLSKRFLRNMDKCPKQEEHKP